MSIEIRQEHAETILDLLSYGLVSGVGEATPGKMCVAAVACYALGLPHGDDPGCVAQPLRRLIIRLNDAVRSSPQARAEGLRRLALAQLGSAVVLDDREFVRRVVEMTIRKAVPASCRAAARVNPKHADQLEAAAVRCEVEGTREAAKHAQRIVSAVAADAAADAAYAAASADAAADAAFVAAAAAAAAADARDRALAQYAEWVVEILIDMKAPGCQWLDLVPKEA